MLQFFHSTIGKKVIVALTGLVLIGFIIGHLLGNLQIFLGPEKFNAYAHFLHENPGLIWGARIFLLFALGFHVMCTVQLVKRNRASRPQAYAQHVMMQAGLASRFMWISGGFLFAYVVYHLLHLTTGQAHPDFIEGDVYRNVVVGFSRIPAALIYILAMGSIGLHLYHGIWSVFQTLGLNHPKFNALRRVIASVISIMISAGYMSIPVSVLFGVVR